MELEIKRTGPERVPAADEKWRGSNDQDGGTIS
jgi:hypothetical protein